MSLCEVITSQEQEQVLLVSPSATKTRPYSSRLNPWHSIPLFPCGIFYPDIKPHLSSLTNSCHLSKLLSPIFGALRSSISPLPFLYSPSNEELTLFLLSGMQLVAVLYYIIEKHTLNSQRLSLGMG